MKMKNKNEKNETKHDRQQCYDTTLTHTNTLHMHVHTVHTLTHELNERKARRTTSPHAYKNASKLITMNDENQNKKRIKTIHYRSTYTKPSVWTHIRATKYEIIDERGSVSSEWNRKRKKQISVRGARARALCGISMVRTSEIRAESGKNLFGFESFCKFRRSSFVFSGNLIRFCVSHSECA